MAKQRRKLGNIYAIPLPNGTFAFGREYTSGLAIAKGRYNNIKNIPDFSDKNIDFFVSVYYNYLTDGEWPKVGNIPFEECENSWGPPTYIEDKMKPGHYQIYYNDEIKEATKEECIGLEVTAAWSRCHVVDRLMGNDKWTEICK